MNSNIKNLSFFAISFKQGFIPPNIPIATFYQGDEILNFLLDSGSDKNVINMGTLERLKYQKIEEEDPVTHLHGVGGEQEVFTCTISFGCEDEKYTEQFLAADLEDSFNVIKKNHCIELHGILGSSFLRDHNIVLDFKNLAAYNKE